MAIYDPVSRAHGYREREASQARESRERREAMSTGMPTPLVAGQNDEQYLQIVEELPEATADQIGRLLYQRRLGANDILYVCILGDDETVRWVAVSELDETAEEIGLWKWTVLNNSQDTTSGVGISSGGEVLMVERRIAAVPPTAFVRRRNASTGASIGTFGSYGTGNGQFDAPVGLAVSSAGNIHVADSALNRVVQFNSSRTFVRNIGSTGTGNGNLTTPRGVACDSSGNVYVADSGNTRVAVFNSSGTWQRNIGAAGTGSGQITNIHGVAVSSTGELFVSDVTLHKVVVYNASTGAFIREFGSFGTSAGQFNYPQSLAVDSSDNVYVGEAGRVQKLTSTGSTMALIGATGSASTGWAASASGVAVTGTEVYVTAKSSTSGSGANGVKRYSVVPAGGIQVADGGTVASSRSTINFVDGTGITTTVADDTTNLRADITIATTSPCYQVTFLQAMGGDGGTLLWTNVAQGPGVPFGFAVTDFAHVEDLRNFTEARVIVSGNRNPTGAFYRILYATSNTSTAASWIQLGSSAQVEATSLTTGTTTGMTIGTWRTLAAGAKIENCYLRPVYGHTGSTTNTVYTLGLWLQLR
jgi:hypothetical protein